MYLKNELRVACLEVEFNKKAISLLQKELYSAHFMLDNLKEELHRAQYKIKCKEEENHAVNSDMEFKEGEIQLANCKI